MNNFIILAKIEEKLEECTIRFLKIVEKHNLCFKQSKCILYITEIPILGVWIGNKEVQIEEEKVKAIKKQKIPIKVKNVESFLGFTNFYQQFIKDFSHIVAPLNWLKDREKWK